jgi:6-pyruvoyltetrahydropterin/6-carboxytetrahydropterin synthase
MPGSGPLYLTKRISFVAAHQLRRAEWSDLKNTEVFGKCFREHGHDYVVEVTVKGPVDPEDGMVINLNDLKRWLNEEIHDVCDHRHFNKDVAFMAGILPTVENMCVEFWEKLARRMGSRGELYRIRVWESPNNSCEYFGPKGKP